MKEQTEQDRLDESRAAKKWWDELVAKADGGDAAAEAEVKRIREAVYMEYHPES